MSFVVLSVISAVGALSSSSATAGAISRIGTTAFDRISNVQLTSVATSEPVLLTDQWRNNGKDIFGIIDKNERCVVEFLRHFG